MNINRDFSITLLYIIREDERNERDTKRSRRRNGKSTPKLICNKTMAVSKRISTFASS
jgi:hypothetical protein